MAAPVPTLGLPSNTGSSPVAMHMSGVITELPAHWSPALAPLVVIPDELCIQQVEFELFSGDMDDPSTVCNPDLALSKNSSSNGAIETWPFSALLNVLSNSFEKARIFQKWTSSNRESVRNLSPAELRMLFSVLPTPEAQIAVANVLKETRETISCAHLQELSFSCLSVCKREVLDLLCTITIVDKENCNIIQNAVGPLNYIALEHHFCQ